MLLRAIRKPEKPQGMQGNKDPNEGTEFTAPQNAWEYIQEHVITDWTRGHCSRRPGKEDGESGDEMIKMK